MEGTLFGNGERTGNVDIVTLAMNMVHALRHTYATRAIESGMQPKVLQKLLGHASITTTMNRYVHVTDDSMKKAVAQFAKAQEAQKG